MTKKAIKWWKSFGFWDKVRLTVGALGVSGEATLFLVEAYPKWKVVAAIATIISIAITYLFKDENNNGIVDLLEKKP